MSKEIAEEAENTLNHKKCNSHNNCFDFAFNDIVFTSTSSENNFFRISHTQKSEGNLIWCENKKTHQQWSTLFKDITSNGPEGVKLPKDVIVSYLRSSLQKNDIKAKSSTETDEGNVELTQNQDGSVTIILTAFISKHWHPQYCFSLFPADLSKIDIQAAYIRDLQDEISLLKHLIQESKKQKVIYFSVGSDSSVGPNCKLRWDSAKRKHIDKAYFEIRSNYEIVIIKVGGLFRVNVVVAGQASNNSQVLTMYCGDEEVEQSYQSNANAYYGTSQITRIIHLNKDDQLSFQWQGNYNTIANNLSTRLQIEKLE